MATAKKLPSGNWRVQVYVGKDAAGKRRYESITAETKKEAEYQAALFALTKKERPDPINITVGQAIDSYIDSKSNVLSPSTVRAYRSLRRNHYPDLMPVKLCDLTPLMVQTAVNADAIGHSPKSVRNVYALLVSALNEAYPDGINLRTRLPQRVKPDIIVPEDEMVARLLDGSRGTPLEIAIILASCQGFRRSEMCALDWPDYDGKRISVTKAKVMDENKNWVIKTTKTTSSKRTVKAMEPTRLILNRYRQLSGPIIDATPSAITEAFFRLKTKLGYPKLRFHDLRHYYASIVHALGIPDKYAMERTGHATAVMLKAVYQHTFDSREAEIDEKIDADLRTRIK